MEKLIPKSIKRLGDFLIEFTWSDGFKSTIKIEALRDDCPCAHCQKERENKKKAKFNIPMLKTFEEGKYILKGLKTVGNYAIRAIWANGHEEGLYDYDYLRDVCERNALNDEDIDKLNIKTNIN